MEVKKKSILNIFVWTLIGLCLAFAIFTSIIVNSRQKEYDKIYEQNEKIIDKDTENDEEVSS